jgi:hypothetical protein
MKLLGDGEPKNVTGIKVKNLKTNECSRNEN